MGSDIHLLLLCSVNLVQLVQSYRERKPINAMTILDKELYVRYGVQPIAVYDTETFSLLRRLSVEGLGGVKDMASCERYQCLYIADYDNKLIHKVEKAGNKQTKWLVGSQPNGLSVNSEFNLMVTYYGFYKVQVFTTGGELVKEISLQQSGIRYPNHIIQLSIGRYVVCHSDGSSLHRIVTVDDKSHISNSFGKEKGSNDDQLQQPVRLTVLNNGFIVVADRDNKRLVMLDTTLHYVKCWNLGGEPFRMWFDGGTQRLYVGVNNRDAVSRVYIRGHVEVFNVT